MCERMRRSEGIKITGLHVVGVKLGRGHGEHPYALYHRENAYHHRAHHDEAAQERDGQIDKTCAYLAYVEEVDAQCAEEYGEQRRYAAVLAAGGVAEYAVELVVHAVVPARAVDGCSARRAHRIKGAHGLAAVATVHLVLHLRPAVGAEARIVGHQMTAVIAFYHR